LVYNLKIDVTENEIYKIIQEELLNKFITVLKNTGVDKCSDYDCAVKTYKLYIVHQTFLEERKNDHRK